MATKRRRAQRARGARAYRSVGAGRPISHVQWRSAGSMTRGTSSTRSHPLCTFFWKRPARVPYPVTVAFGHAQSRITRALTVGPVARERNERPVEIHELAGAELATAKAPRRVRGDWGQQLQAPDTGHLVAIGVHLRDAHGEGFS